MLKIIKNILKMVTQDQASQDPATPISDENANTELHPPVGAVDTPNYSTEPDYWAGQADDSEVKEAYDYFALEYKPVSNMKANELAIVARYGNIIAGERSQQVSNGRAAKVQMVRQKMDGLQRQYAVLKLAQEGVAITAQDLQNARAPKMPVEVVFRVAGVEVTLTQADIRTMAPAQTMAHKAVEKAITDICAAVQQTIMTNQARINAGEGENFGLPFDFQTDYAAIKNTYLDGEQ
jgi:hypothetical protein